MYHIYMCMYTHCFIHFCTLLSPSFPSSFSWIDPKCLSPLPSSPLQFSHGTVSTVADNTSQLADILKFGLDTLLQSDER